ncbi:hypothetical protein QBC39DRAFT_339176 [Podospora conica]|nr:hypothetical protein QBC39DRAFT_339176 [Schizothecium conicum]
MFPPLIAATAFRMATTSTTLLAREQDHLRDYTIRLTGAPAPAPAQEATPPQPAVVEQVSRSPSPSPLHVEYPSPERPTQYNNPNNPPGWESSYRQVPPHRPVNRNLDAELRPWGAHSGQSPFVFMMMHGVWFKSSVAWLWRKTGGRVNDGVFRSPVGGEA